MHPDNEVIMKDSSAIWNYSNTVPKVDFSNPDEMIRANGAAEAAQTDRLKAEVEDYTKILAELRQLYEKNNELVQKLQFLNRNTTENIKKLIEDNNAAITQKLEALEEWDHKAFEQEMKASVSDAKMRSWVRSGSPPRRHRNSLGKPMISATETMCACTEMCRRL